jgi:hypothetical protein
VLVRNIGQKRQATMPFLYHRRAFLYHNDALEARGEIRSSKFFISGFGLAVENDTE